MDRFYKRSMEVLKSPELNKKCQAEELHDDIKSYVDYLEHERSILLSEIHRIWEKKNHHISISNIFNKIIK